MKKIILVILLILVSVCVTAGNIIIEEDSLEIGTISAQNHIFPTENAFLSYGLVGYWSGDDNALDYSGKGNDGTLSGATYTNGKFGKAFGFDGVNDYINFTSKTYDLSSGTTFSFWAKRTNGDHIVFSSGATNSYQRLIFLGSGYVGQLYFESNTNADDCTAVPSSTTYDDNWHYYTLTIKDYICTFYRDGINVTGDAGPLTNNITIRKMGVGQSTYFFNGSIDDVRIWNRSLSQAEIRRLYSEYWIPGDTSETRNFHTTGNVTSSNFIDLTPAWSKTPVEALNELLKVKSGTDASGNTVIDHSSLPEFTKAKLLKETNLVNCKEICSEVATEEEPENECYEECDTEYIYEDGRNIGATVTMVVEAIKALREENTLLKKALCKIDSSYEWC
jgi:hypothetical protein